MDTQTASSSYDDAMLTVRDVAKYLKLSQATIYKWAKAKKIPAMKIGRNWRFDRREIDVWTKEGQADYGNNTPGWRPS